MRKKTREDFIADAIKVHGDKYDYSQVVYKDSDTKVTILCNHCLILFEQRPYSHLHGSGCPICGRKRGWTKHTKTTQQFIEEANKIHKNRYDYSKSVYKKAKSKLLIKCKKCNYEFMQSPDCHLRGEGCPNCARSKGELRIYDYLVHRNISFVEEKTYPELYWNSRESPLRYDFYLPEYNLLIEYNGRQHYEHMIYFHGTHDTLEEQQERDRLKSDYARDHGLELLVIRYDEDIEMKLKEALKINE